MPSMQQSLKILGNITLVLITLPAVIFCGFYTGLSGAKMAGMPHHDWDLSPLLHGSVGGIAALLIYLLTILLLQFSKSLPLALAIVFGTILALLVSPLAGAISFKISQTQ